jgi:5-methylcytosine-specific restriction endonuclease McrA
MQPGGWRTQGMTSSKRGYNYRWQKARKRFLEANPLCVRCMMECPDTPEPATVVDHKTPHRGDETLFWDESNWQALCASHHSSDKQREENAQR